MTDPDRVYAIGDVHGYLDKLRAVHASIERDLAERPAASHAVVHIGDYVDRGPESRGVIDHLIAGADRGAPWINLMGNHDRMMLRFVERPGGRDPRNDPRYFWLHNRVGGAATLRSYGIKIDDDATEEDGAVLHDVTALAVKERHVAFLRGLKTSWLWRGVFFAHAGVKPGVPLADQDADDLLWIRDEFLWNETDHGALIVHGHTPVDRVEDHGNRIAIDTGAGYGGPLSCVVFDEEGVRVLGGPVLREDAADGG